jgi:hypothetical protein
MAYGQVDRSEMEGVVWLRNRWRRLIPLAYYFVLHFASFASHGLEKFDMR